MGKALTIVTMLVLPIAVFATVFVIGQGSTSTQTRAADPNQVEAGSYIAASTFVDSDTPDKNYGESTTLWADGESKKITYIKFNLADLAGKNIKSAVLKMFVTHGSEGVEQINMVPVSAWLPNEITYSVRPLVGEQIATINGGQNGEWVSVDLTSFVKEHAGQVVSVAISSDDPNGLAFNSAKAPFDRMELVVEE